MAPRVLSANAADTEPRVDVKNQDNEAPVFEDTLSNGKFVMMREVTANDLLYLERKLVASGEVERTMKLAVRISMAPGLLSFDELKRLGMTDLKKVTRLVKLASGTKASDLDDDDDDDDDDEFSDSGGGSKN